VVEDGTQYWEYAENGTWGPCESGIRSIVRTDHDGHGIEPMNIFAIATAVGIFTIAVVVLLGLWLLLRE
jgi:hypothetical protein